MFLGVCAFRNGSLLYVPSGMGHFYMCFQEWVISVCAFRNGSFLYLPSGMGHSCTCLQEWVISVSGISTTMFQFMLFDIYILIFFASKENQASMF